MQIQWQVPLKWLKTLKLILIVPLLYSSFSGEVCASSPSPDPPISLASQKPSWKRLLYFNPSKSMVDNKEFFLSPKGKRDSLAELQATIDHLNSDKIVGFIKRPTACVFPARKKWIEKNLGLKFPEVACPEYTHWKTVLNVGKIVMVYSAEYPGNPASMFGHTFLRLENKSGRNDLLDYALSYGAETDGSDPAPLYAVKGLFGGYTGRFSLHPYYMKVNEYTHSEGRDLWEYPLPLSTGEIDFLVDHLWELYAAASFDYYFFDENCSTLLGHYIDVVRPDWKLINISRGYVMPLELVKALPPTSKKFRASAKKKFQVRVDQLNELQFSHFKESIEVKNIPSSVEAIDATIAFYNLEKHKKFNLNKDRSFHLAALLHERSKKDVKQNDIEIKQELGPRTGHGSTRISLMGGIQNHDSFQELNFQWIHRDFLAPDRGMVPFNHFNFIDVGIIHYDRPSLVKLKKLDFINATNLRPMRRFEIPLSWKASIGYRSALSRDFIKVNSGIGMAIGNEKWKVGGLFSLEQYYSGEEDKHFLTGIGPEVVGMIRLNRFKSLLKINPLIFLQAENQWSTLFRWGNSYEWKRDHQVRLIFEKPNYFDKKRWALEYGYTF